MASLQQVVEQLALLATNGTTGPDATSRGPLDFVTTMLFSASALREWAILLVIGSLFETARRLLSSLWDTLTDAFFITAVFEDDDISFQWIMHWLSRQPSWKTARNVQISTSNFDLHGEHFDSNEDSSSHARKVNLLPAVSESYTFWYKHRWMRVTREVDEHRGGWYTTDKLILSIMTRDHGILAGILQDAKDGYVEAQRDKIAIFVSDKSSNGSDSGWRVLATRPKRSLNSIILDPGITELVVEDIRDFLDSKDWYIDRGIPFRRGYLLYGAPGSGKTSLIHSIAGELGLNVYIISLSRSGLDDTGLSELISALPERCIALMEDIDAAFHHGLSRESPQSPPAQCDDSKQPPGMQGAPAPSGNRVSLSGLLNALDGIGAQEGRILFATTNKYGSLDPALCRPGRMDLHIEFKLASQYQAEVLFKRFYAPPSIIGGTQNEPATSPHADAGKDARSGDLIDLSESQASTLCATSTPPSPSEKSNNARSAPTYVGLAHRARAPMLSHDCVNVLAAQFALAVPERKLSMASLQGFLMMHKARPFVAVADIGAWVEKELSERKD